MDCAEIEEVVRRYSSEGDSADLPYARQQLEEHLQTCPNCARYAAELDAIRQQITRLGTRESPKKLTYSLAARIKAERLKSEACPHLLSHPYFWGGMATLLDWSAACVGTRDASAEDADVGGVVSDWSAVGRDLEYAILAAPVTVE